MKTFIVLVIATLGITSCQAKSIEASPQSDHPTLTVETLSSEQYQVIERDYTARTFMLHRMDRELPSINVPMANQPVVYLDFKGGVVNNSVWQNATYAPANLNLTDQYKVLSQTQHLLSPYNICVTNSLKDYLNTSARKRFTCIVTERIPRFSQYKSASYLYSFSWGNDTPGFVSTSALRYDPGSISQSIKFVVDNSLGKG